MNLLSTTSVGQGMNHLARVGAVGAMSLPVVGDALAAPGVPDVFVSHPVASVGLIAFGVGVAAVSGIAGYFLDGRGVSNKPSVLQPVSRAELDRVERGLTTQHDALAASVRALGGRVDQTTTANREVLLALSESAQTMVQQANTPLPQEYRQLDRDLDRIQLQAYYKKEQFCLSLLAGAYSSVFKDTQASLDNEKARVHDKLNEFLDDLLAGNLSTEKKSLVLFVKGFCSLLNQKARGQYNIEYKFGCLHDAKQEGLRIEGALGSINMYMPAYRAGVLYRLFSFETSDIECIVNLLFDVKNLDEALKSFKAIKNLVMNHSITASQKEKMKVFSLVLVVTIYKQAKEEGNTDVAEEALNAMQEMEPDLAKIYGATNTDPTTCTEVDRYMLFLAERMYLSIKDYRVLPYNEKIRASILEAREKILNLVEDDKRQSVDDKIKYALYDDVTDFCINRASLDKISHIVILESMKMFHQMGVSIFVDNIALLFCPEYRSLSAENQRKAQSVIRGAQLFVRGAYRKENVADKDRADMRNFANHIHKIINEAWTRQIVEAVSCETR